jgi:hypothetical protein
MELLYPIDDVRDSSFFSNSTFSKYQKTKVKEKLIESLTNSQMEPTCYWTTEMVCSGQFSDLWDLLLFFFSKYVHTGNPKLVLYLDYRFQLFKKHAAKAADELDLRNVAAVRQLFAEITCVLCLSVKRPGLDAVKVSKEDLEVCKDRLKAPSADYVKPFFKDGDPLELYAPLNELCYAISAGRTLTACYWIEWVVLFAKAKGASCAPRRYVDGKKTSTDIIWIVWDILRAYAKPGLPEKAAYAAVNLFCSRYTSATFSKRRFLMYFAVSLCCDAVDTTSEIVADKEKLEQVIPQCSLFYRDIRAKSIRLKKD